ncbi:unnamed protein product [Lampetra planeri]
MMSRMHLGDLLESCSLESPVEATGSVHPPSNSCALETENSSLASTELRTTVWRAWSSARARGANPGNGCRVGHVPSPPGRLCADSSTVRNEPRGGGGSPGSQLVKLYPARPAHPDDS